MCEKFAARRLTLACLLSLVVCMMLFGCRKSPEEVQAERQAAGEALRKAAGEGNLERVRSLIAEGADANAVGSDGVSALMNAAARGDAGIIRELIRGGGNVNTADRAGRTVLMYASANPSRRENNDGKVEAVREILQAGAGVNAGGPRGITALMEAATWGEAAVAEELADAGAALDAGDHQGMTALMWAANQPASVRDTTDVVDYLIYAGADLNIKSNNGWTALDYARRHDTNPEVARLLENAGAKSGTSDATKEASEQDDLEQQPPSGSKKERDPREKRDPIQDLLSIPGRILEDLDKPLQEAAKVRPLPESELEKVRVSCKIHEKPKDGIIYCIVQNGSSWDLRQVHIEFRGSTLEGASAVRDIYMEPEEPVPPGETFSAKKDSGMMVDFSVTSFHLRSALGSKPQPENKDQGGS